MKTFKGKDLTVFVRFGGLDPIKQKGYGKETYHSPPASRGFYAMPKVVQEFFLIGSLSSTQLYKFPKSPKYPEKGENFEQDVIKFREESDNFDWDKHNKRTDKIYSLIRREFKKTTGNIWHHLGEYVDNNEVIERHDSWVKTTIQSWTKAFSRRSLNDRYGEDQFSTNNINKSRGIAGFYSKDHFEVFFDEKV